MREENDTGYLPIYGSICQTVLLFLQQMFAKQNASDLEGVDLVGLHLEKDNHEEMLDVDPVALGPDATEPVVVDQRLSESQL